MSFAFITARLFETLILKPKPNEIHLVLDICEKRKLHGDQIGETNDLCFMDQAGETEKSQLIEVMDSGGDDQFRTRGGEFHPALDPDRGAFSGPYLDVVGRAVVGG